jgi:hypothetical protein
MGRVVRQIFRDPEDSFSLMSIIEIMTAVRAKYGKMKKDTRTELAFGRQHDDTTGDNRRVRQPFLKPQ